MNRKLFLAALLAASPVLASAADPHEFDKQGAAAAETRAEVHAEARQPLRHQIADDLEPYGFVSKVMAEARQDREVNSRLARSQARGTRSDNERLELRP